MSELALLKRELEDLKKAVLPKLSDLEARIKVLEDAASEAASKPANVSSAPELSRLEQLRLIPAGSRSEEDQLELEILEEKEELRKLKTITAAGAPPPAPAPKAEDMVWEALQQKAKHIQPLPRVSEAERNLAALQQELSVLESRTEMEVEAESSSEKLTETPPPDDEANRRRARASSALRLSSTQSFSTSPQAELASSPSLKRAVRRSRPVQKPLPTPMSDDEIDEDEDGEDLSSEEHLVIGRRSLKGSMDEELQPKKPDPSQLQEAKKQFATLAKQYYSWVAEALEDISFREFGSTLEEVRSFKEMLDESDKDISGPSRAQFDNVVRSWKDLVAVSPSADGAEPFTSLKLDDVQELFESVMRALAARQIAYAELVETLKSAQEAEQKKMEDKRKKEEEERNARLEEEAAAAAAKKLEQEKMLKEAQLEQERKELEEKARLEAEEKKGLDFDISKELMGLDFVTVAPAAPAAAVQDLDAIIAAVSPRKETTSPRKDSASPRRDSTSPRKDESAIQVGDLVEAIWDQDGQWYKARIEEFTEFGYWLVFVEYGNAQDTAPGAVRKLPKAKAVPSEAPKQVFASLGASAGSKLVAKKQKIGSGGVVAGPKKIPASAAASPSSVPLSQQQPALEDVRAPVGGIAARMAMLQEQQQQQQAASERKNKRLSGLEQRNASNKVIGSQVEDALSKPPAARSSGKIERRNEVEDEDEDDDDDKDSDEEDAQRVMLPMKVELISVRSEAPRKEAEVLPPLKMVAAEPVMVKASNSPRAVEAAAVPPLAKASTSPRATEAFPVKSPRSNKAPVAAPAAAAAAAAAAPEPAALSESEQKLLILREQLRKSREVASAAPAAKTPARTAAKKPEPAAAVPVVRPVLTGINGEESIPSSSLANADEILTAAISAHMLVAPIDAPLPPVDLPARDKKRYEAVMAFITSEKEYYDQLCVLMSLFWIPLRDRVLSEEETEELFGNIPTIWGIHKLFLTALMESASGWTPERCIGPVLELYAPLFKLYQGYTAQVGRAMVALTKFKTKHAKAKEFKDLVAQNEASPACLNTNLRSLLNVPVRRPSAYPPLARAIQKATNKDNLPAEFAVLESACKSFEAK